MLVIAYVVGTETAGIDVDVVVVEGVGNGGGKTDAAGED